MLRSIRFWYALLLGVLVVSIGLSTAFTVEGNANDPLLAEAGNALGPLALVGIVVLACVQLVRWLRTRGERA